MLEKKAIDYEKAVLIGIINSKQNEEKVTEYLDELEFLTYTAGGEVTKRFVQRVEIPNPKTFIGSGKMEEVQRYVKANDIGSVIFDDELNLLNLDESRHWRTAREREPAEIINYFEAYANL